METTGIFGLILVLSQLVFLEGLLSIDNAMVLGAMVSVLPEKEPAPYPEPLKFLQKATNKFLGGQQAAALKVGLLGAYLGRGLMLALAAWVIRQPMLRILGALYLVKLALDHISEIHQANESDDSGVETGHNQNAAKAFWLVVLNVELADLAFSLDNVVVAVALSDKLWVVLLGVAIGIVVMRFAAGIFTKLIKLEPILVTAAYLVVWNIGVELLLAEFLHIHFETWQKFSISVATILVCLAYAHLEFLHILGPLFNGIGRIIGYVNGLFNGILRLLFSPLRLLFSALSR